MFCHFSLSPIPTPMFCIPGFRYSETELNNKACFVLQNKACVVYDSYIVAFSVSNHLIKFI